MFLPGWIRSCCCCHADFRALFESCSCLLTFWTSANITVNRSVLSFPLGTWDLKGTEKMVFTFPWNLIKKKQVWQISIKMRVFWSLKLHWEEFTDFWSWIIFCLFQIITLRIINAHPVLSCLRLVWPLKFPDLLHENDALLLLFL